MATQQRQNTWLDRIVEILLDLPWLEALTEGAKLARRLWLGLAEEGMYEVLAHEATLELLDRHGRKALVRKRQKVRYNQNNIIAYQDQAWGDGEILLDYRCRPGVVVDRWRPGQKTLLLISLRETRRRGDVDEFRMEWGIRCGFTRPEELWEAEVNHRTRRLHVQVIFPKSRPPRRAWLVEALRRRKHRLGQEELLQLADGRWLLSWETARPRLNERYQLLWEW